MTKRLFKSVICTALILTSSALWAAMNNLSQALSPQLSVSGEMTQDKFQQLIKQGFKSVIVNRPDQEQGNTVRVDQLRNIAKQSKVSVITNLLPAVKFLKQTWSEFAKYYNELPKPILMVCKSGARSSLLFNQAKQRGLLHE